jgi:hypothetical protein
MPQISVLGLLLPLVGHVDQQIESIAFRVTVNRGVKLLLVQFQQFFDSGSEILHQAAMLFAPEAAP